MKIEWLQCSHFLTISGFTAIFPLPLLLLFGRSPNKEPLGSITPTNMDFFLFHMHFSNYVASLHSIQYQCSDHSQVYVLFTSVFLRDVTLTFSMWERDIIEKLNWRLMCALPINRSRIHFVFRAQFPAALAVCRLRCTILAFHITFLGGLVDLWPLREIDSGRGEELP